MIRLNDERYWLYAALNPATNRLLHVQIFLMRRLALTEMFLSELQEKQLVNSAPGCRPPATVTGSDSSMSLMGIGTLLSLYFAE